jgi:Nucleotidyl transferase AbiEii toxin, Type IV TA system
LSKSVTNIPASVRQRLLNLARERKEDFGLLLTKYSLQRVLYRIAESKYRDQFVLKGALLFELWTDQRYRPTRDADFLARGRNDPERFKGIFKEICEIKIDEDGLVFDANTVIVERIAEDASYEGIRVRFVGYLEKARTPIQIDLGFGDAITPAPIETKIPSLLDLPTLTLLTYPRESVIAEKFEAMISLGIANSRMKDLYDIQVLSREFTFDGIVLSEAIRKTFATRGTQLPLRKPVVFTAEFFDDADKKKQWTAFCRKNSNYIAEASLRSICEEISAFLMPVILASAGSSAMPGKWSARAWI